MLKPYKCTKCGAEDCKLWREYQIFANLTDLYCVKCACIVEKKDINNVTPEGRIKTDPKYSCRVDETTDQIGWLVPAVPTEENDAYWGYTSVPQDKVNWWYSLPTFTEK